MMSQANRSMSKRACPMRELESTKLGRYRREAPSTGITRMLLDYLLSREVELGDRIPPERQLAQVLGVGRSTVREAIKSLSLLGLLEVRQGDGTYLIRSTSDLLPRVIDWGLVLEEPFVIDLVEARERVEPMIAELAAKRRSDEDLENLRRLVGKMRASTDDIEEYVDADTAFHLRLAEAAGNEVFRNFLGTVRALLRVRATSILRAAGEPENSLQMHVPILEAVERGDGPAARKAMTAHVQHASRCLREALGEGGERTSRIDAR
jgi:GntR family transcriptional repressor for pyruvate dehydrogenase complex